MHFVCGGGFSTRGSGDRFWEFFFWGQHEVEQEMVLGSYLDFVYLSFLFKLDDIFIGETFAAALRGPAAALGFRPRSAGMVDPGTPATWPKMCCATPCGPRVGPVAQAIAKATATLLSKFPGSALATGLLPR